MYILYGGVQFTSYSVANTRLSHFEKSHDIKMAASTHSLIVGAIAGTCSTLTTYPFDFLRTRLAANSGKHFLPFLATTRSIFHKEGLTGFFAGVKPAVISVTASTAVMFWAYSISRDISSNVKIPFIEPICGFLAGATGKAMVFPLDLVRKRLQMYKTMHNPGFKSTVRSMMLNIVRKEGFMGFYKGFWVSVLKTAPTSGISIWMYEVTIRLLH